MTNMPAETSGSAEWRPKIVALLCNWCSYTGADLAGISRVRWSPAVHIVRVMCSGRLDPTFVVKAFRMGADGVIVSGCHPGDCHYQKGNYKALRRVHLLKRLLADFGIEPERLRLVWVSASEGTVWARVANEMEATVRALGPLELAPMASPPSALEISQVSPEAGIEIPPSPTSSRREASATFPKGGTESLPSGPPLSEGSTEVPVEKGTERHAS